MSSGQHTPRRSPSLRDLSRHDLLAVLSHDQQRTADNRPVPYVARIGRDRHLVRNPGSDVVYSVGGPAMSFKPGTIVLLGSNTGRPGESIIALPSPAQRGASAYPESRFGGSITFPEADEPPSLEPAGIQMLAFWRDASTDELECWEVNADGSPGDLFSSVAVADQINHTSLTERGRRMAEFQSIMHSAGPIITWFTDDEGSGTVGFQVQGYAWNPVSGALGTWMCTAPPFPETNLLKVGCPLIPEGLSDIYWIQHDAPHPTTASKLRLYKVGIGGGSPTLLSTREPPGFVSSGEVGRFAAAGCPNSRNFITVHSGLHWFHLTDGNNYAGTTTGDSDKISGSGWRPYAGNDGTGDWCLWFDRTPTGQGRVKRIKFDEAAKSWDNAETWGASANSSYTGVDCALTINALKNTAGMYPHNGPEAGGGYLKLFQPLGGTGSEGNNASDPRIFIQARGGHVPHFVHLVNYSHPWS